MDVAMGAVLFLEQLSVLRGGYALVFFEQSAEIQGVVIADDG